jgi:hypothetical protein
VKEQSVLELQNEIFSEIFGYAEIAAPSTGAEPAVATFVAPVTEEPERGKKARQPKVEDIALGITEGVDEGDRKLAILVQDRRKLRSNMVEKIKQKAAGEAEILFIGRQRAQWTRTRNDPLMLGCSVSPATVAYSGTLGCFCKDDQTGARSILSNNHVFADVNRIAAGTRIIQPGGADKGKPASDVIAQLTRFVPVQFGGLPNLVDAAVAALIDHGRREDHHSISGSASPPVAALTLSSGTPVPAVPGMTVYKTGRTTLHTVGVVRAVGVNHFNVNMGSAGVARFDNQIVIHSGMPGPPPQPFSRPGDSGSLIVDGGGNPVGLLFAGSTTGGTGGVGYTGANPISTVMAQLGVTLI